MTRSLPARGDDVASRSDERTAGGLADENMHTGVIQTIDQLDRMEPTHMMLVSKDVATEAAGPTLDHLS